MRYIHWVSPGQLLREARRRHRLSQERLATRAGTTQSAISRIERDQVSPSVDTLRELLHMLGEDLTLRTEPREWGIDRTLIRERLRLTPAERVDYGLAFAEQLIQTSPNVRSSEGTE
ncbi:MAG TPA: helix-turn-helix domain-containing protein [Solirubrobacterales bacterium]